VKNFKIFSSSAGSGKTYTLTKEYLKLALSQEESGYFKRILAITFTNDAANEMKERILLALKAFSDEGFLSEIKRHAYSQLLASVVTEINEKLGAEAVNETMLRKRAGRMFSRILHEYSDFSVGTIDSFTNRVVSAFTEELDLPYNYEIDLNARESLQQAVDRLLEKVGPQSQETHLSATLEEFILEKAEEGGSFRYLPEELSDFGTNLLNEKALDAVKSLSSLELKDFGQVRKQVQDLLKEQREAILNVAHECTDLLGVCGLTPQDFAEATKGIGGYFEGLLKKEDSKLYDEAGLTVRKTLEASDWANKKTKLREEVNQLQSLFRKAFEQVEKLKQACLLLEAIYKHLHKVSVLNEIERELRVLKNERNTVHLSDFNKSIVQIVLNEPVPFIYERLGEKYNHILIDEFQDTSSLQWNNLMPLVENSLGYGHLNLLVGDAKQAIYGWRGGDMEQIVHLAKNRLTRLVERHKTQDAALLEQRYLTLQQYIAPQYLKINYRSQAEIIQFNNDLFRFASRYYQEERPLLADVYDDYFEQELPANPRTGGHLEVTFIDKSVPEGEERTEAQVYLERSLEQVLRIVRQAQEAGYQYKDMAVLVRRNTMGKQVAAFLSAQGIQIISSDSLLLQLSEAVRFLIAFMESLHKPTNGLVKYECLQVFHLYLLKRLPDEGEEAEIEQIVQEKGLWSFFQYFSRRGYPYSFHRLSQLGLYELSEQLTQWFGLRKLPRQADFLYRFLDVVLEFGLQQSNHLADFLEFWESRKDKLSINTPKNWDAITVTSIHKSKGLEYPVVILAFADWDLANPPAKSIFWADLTAAKQELAGLQDLPLQATALSHNRDISRTPLKAQYEEEIMKLFVENLNILYVALTRPTDRMYILTECLNFQTTKRQTVSVLLYQYLLEKQHWNQGLLNYVLSEGLPRGEDRQEVLSLSPFVLEERESADWRKKLWQLRTFHESVFDAEHFDRKQEYCNKMAYVLTQIQQAGETGRWLRLLASEGKTDAKEVRNLEKDLQQLLSQPEIAPYFDSEAELVTEKLILHQSTATSKSPDRIVLQGKKVSLLLFRSKKLKEEDGKLFRKYDGLLRKMGYAQIEKIWIDLEKKALHHWE
jgi:ATP-dependent helicase/nuclease subunit A